ncbi:chondroitinase family polysaccharide lyase [Pseudocolwellia sp. HL-MZ19]|uniref:chondroitinase family polysaccharide lyase n=1 Tax=Pseudocolwellia sp. HL-MZ19 TaxID=3400846 RepID=UPI003CEB8284
MPFIQKETQLSGNDLWMPLFRYMDNIENILPNKLDNTDLIQLEKIEEKIQSLLLPDNSKSMALVELKSQFDTLLLLDNGSSVVGPPLTFRSEETHYDATFQGVKIQNKLRDFGKILKAIAIEYTLLEGKGKNELATLFITATRYYLDQGWQYGSSMSSTHHIGYSTRELTEAFFIMRKVLQQADLLTSTSKGLQWFSNLGSILKDKSSFNANIDYMNTQAFYHLLLILLSNDNEIKAALLHKYSAYISTILAQNDARGVFKIDGTAWHHGGHYPAYALGAFQKIPQTIWALSGTPFQISTAGHANFKKAFLASRLYSQSFDFGFGNAGRHPFDGNFSSLKKQYLQLAFSGDPEHLSNIDADIAAAYLRLWGNEDANHKALFNDAGINAEVLSGYYSFPYAATAVHRRNHWAALIKGYSKYVWSSEIYAASNRYGRYPANGTVQLLNQQGEKGSGFIENGWDWNRFPGGTSVNLPFNELETNKPLLMFRSAESFAGSVSLNKNGLFAMQLNDSKGVNHETNDIVMFPTQLKAKKSVFSFGDKIILIGTGISSEDQNNAVETTLFQTSINKDQVNITRENQAESIVFPYKNKAQISGNNWLIDSYNNGYHILSSNNLNLEVSTQHSYHDKYSLKTGKHGARAKGKKATQGDFAVAWLDHGAAPKNESYQYVIYPFMNTAEREHFATKVLQAPSYKIVKADDQSHIVTDNESDMTGYTIFSVDKPINYGLLLASSDPALVLIEQKEENSITLAATQPDLHFDKVHPIQGFSQPVLLKLTIKGLWKLSDVNVNIATLQHRQGNTEITLKCQHGLSVKVVLSKG